MIAENEKMFWSTNFDEKSLASDIISFLNAFVSTCRYSYLLLPCKVQPNDYLLQ